TQQCERPPHPRRDVFGGGNQRGRDKRQPGLEREEVSMHRADDAMQAVPTQAGSPMNVGLEQAAGNRSAYRKDQGEEKRSGDVEERRWSGQRATFEQGPLANAERGEPADR